MIMALATLYAPSYATARRGGLRGAGGISTDARIAANSERGFCPKNRSAAVVPSGPAMAGANDQLERRLRPVGPRQGTVSEH